MLLWVILLYVLMHFHIIYNIFWTDLLTQCPVPVFVCFCPCIAEKGEKSKCSENYRKIPKNLLRHKTPEGGRTPGGGPPLAQAPLGRGQGGTLWLPGPVGPPPVPPFGIYLRRPLKTLEEEPFFANTLLFHRRRDPKIGINKSSCPDTLPEGGLISRGFSTTMLSSGMHRE